MNCPKCGKETPDGALFCTGCGYRLENPIADAPKTTTDDETGLEQVISESAESAETMPAANDTEQVGESIGEKAVSEEAPDTVELESDMQPLPVYETPETANIPVNNSAVAPSNGNKTPENEFNTPYFSVEPTDGKKKKSKEISNLPVKPLSAWSYIWRELIFFIPIVNIVVLFVFAFAEGINRNSRAFARSRLIYALIITLLLAVGAILLFLNLELVIDTLREWLISIANWMESMIE